MKTGSKKNQVGKLKLILICFIYHLSIGHRTIKRDTTRWSWQNQSAQNPERFSRVIRENQILRVCWNISYWSDWYCTPVRSVIPVPEQVRSTRLVRFLYRISGVFSGHVWSSTRHIRWMIWPLEFEHHRTCPALLRTCPGPNPNLSSERIFISEWSGPISSHSPGLTGLLWQLQWLVFQIPIKNIPPLSRGLLVPNHLHNILIVSWALPNHSLWDLSSLWRIFSLGGEFCAWDTWVQSLSTLDCVKHSWNICYSWRWSLLHG
jgi:hypothetical protein